MRKIQFMTTDPVLNWSLEVDGEDIQDAIDHTSLMRNRSMSNGLVDVIEDALEEVEPETLLPASAFKGKKKGWLLEYPRDSWQIEFKKVYNKDIKHILEASRADGINSAIAIDGSLADGYTRTFLAYAVGEKVPVQYFKGKESFASQVKAKYLVIFKPS